MKEGFKGVNSSELGGMENGRRTQDLDAQVLDLDKREF